MRRYIRVECVNRNTGESIGGYFGALTAILARKLSLPANADIDVMAEKMQQSDAPDMETIYQIMIELGDLPYPEIYLNDKENYVCLYEMHEFYEAMYSLQELDELVRKDNRKLAIECREFYLEDDEVVYSDGYQIVISKEVYDAYSKEYDYRSLASMIEEMEDFFSEEFDDFDEDEDIFE